MFVDIRGQKACLNKVSWQKLAPRVDVSHWGESNFAIATVHGLPAEKLGQGQTDGVNMVGRDWLRAGKLMLLADYNADRSLLMVSDDTPQARFPELPVVGA